MFSSHGSLIPVAAWMKRHRIWTTFAAKVHVPQKAIYYQPHEKVLVATVGIMCGIHGLVEINGLRPDKAICQAFDLPGWPDQSTVSETFSACGSATVQEMRTYLTELFRQYSPACRQRFRDRLQILDVDLTGLPCGEQAEEATKGYFAEQPGRRGRQLGRVVDAASGEIVVQALYPGRKQLSEALIPLVEMAEHPLGIALEDRDRRSLILLRTDAGGGTEDEINWALGRGYQILTKLKNHQRTQKLVQSVVTWYDDPKVPGRSVGLVEQPYAFVAPTIQVAIRSVRERKGKQETTTRVLVISLSREATVKLAGVRIRTAPPDQQVALAAAHLYDDRGGGAETENRQDKQGLGLTKRNKKSFAAQEMLVLLAELVHNLLLWVRRDMAKEEPDCRKLGLKRLVREVFQIPGQLVPAPSRGEWSLILSRDHHMSQKLLRPLQVLAGSKLVVNLGEI